MRTSRGVARMEKRFLRRKRRREEVMSAKEPSVNVRVERARPRMVRYWKCQP